MARTPTKQKAPISVVERRLKSGAVFGLGSKAIPLIEPERWTLRVINTQLSDARLWEIQAEKGWIYVLPEDLAVKPQEIGFRELDGHVVRGTHGQEVLMKIPRPDYLAVQRAKDVHNRKMTFGTRATKDAIVQAAARSYQDDGSGGLDGSGRAADVLDRAQLVVNDSLERVAFDK